MALNNEDLQQIEKVVEKVVERVVERVVDRVVAKAIEPLATKDDLDRMEGRLVSSMNILERDSFSRLDEHEARISKLEQAAAR